MTRNFIIGLLALTVAAAGCGKEEDQKKEEGNKEAAVAKDEAVAKEEAPNIDESPAKRGLQASQEEAYRGTLEELKVIKKTMVGGKPEKVDMNCELLGAYAEALKAVDDEKVKALLADATRTCGFEQPLLGGKAAASAMEEALKKDPEAILLSECMELRVALDQLTKDYADDEQVKKLKELAVKHCE